jgi:hypothetical protein
MECHNNQNEKTIQGASVQERVEGDALEGEVNLSSVWKELMSTIECKPKTAGNRGWRSDGKVLQ